MERYLSWFLGPKAENSLVFENILKTIVRDYLHWRKNYFPQDAHLISSSDARCFSSNQDELNQKVNEFLAEMRRNFPFYNPRYMGHMLSDITMPSMLGYLTGMLYNPNNVTTEAAPVTTRMEIEACNDVAEMIGYKIPPAISTKDYKSKKEWIKYKKTLSNELSWSHISSGGTLANIEALWVARCVKYLPLSIKDICSKNDISISIKMPNGGSADISKINGYDLINIKPNESIYLFSRYISAYIKNKQASSSSDIQKYADEAIAELNKSDYSLSKGLGKLLSEYPLAIFVSGSAHYSWSKAADLLGIGKNNIVNIEMTPLFQMDVNDLKRQLNNRINSKNRKRISPLAVIGIVGTTEEGAVDPIASMSDVRTEFEQNNNVSFWLHIDAAWGGYIKSIIQLNSHDECIILVRKIFRTLYKDRHDNISMLESLNLIMKFIFDFFKDKGSFLNISEFETIISTNDKLIESNDDVIRGEFEDLKRKVRKSDYVADSSKNRGNKEVEVNSFFDMLKLIFLSKKHISHNDFENANIALYELGLLVFSFPWKDYDQTYNYIKNTKSFQINLEDRIVDFSAYTKTSFDMKFKGISKNMSFHIYNRSLISSLLAMNRADSVTIDPHKMGYVPYPCGIISFKNDRVRHFITQKAPYITSVQHNALLHNPPRHYNKINFDKLDLDNLPTELTISTDAFASFILEGSKPGASAASLWLANRCIPLNRSGHGEIVKNTLISTRILYMWMTHWNEFLKDANEPIEYEILPLSPEAPDLNLLVFTVKPLTANVRLNTVNEFVSKVYDRYSIQAELGDETYSYSQPFFLSKTSCDNKTYKYSMFADFFRKAGISASEKDYNKHGLVMLRATLMNPYIYPYKNNKGIDFIGDFMDSLHKTIKSLLVSRDN